MATSGLSSKSTKHFVVNDFSDVRWLFFYFFIFIYLFFFGWFLLGLDRFPNAYLNYSEHLID